MYIYLKLSFANGAQLSTSLFPRYALTMVLFSCRCLGLSIFHAHRV